MFSKSLIQFSVDGWSCVTSLLLELRPNYGGGNEENGDLIIKVPCLRWRLLDTHGHVWVSLLWGHCSFLLGPGAHKVLFLPSKSLFPQSWVSSDGSMVGLMSSLSKRDYAIPRSAAPRALPLQQSTSDPHLRRRHSYTVLAQSLLGIWVLVQTGFVSAL